MPCVKIICRSTSASMYLSAAENEERPSSCGYTSYKPVVNRGYCSPISLHTVSFVHASEEQFKTICSMLWSPWKARERVVSWTNRPVGVPSCPTPLRPAVSPCCAPPRPARRMSWFKTRQANRLSNPSPQSFVKRSSANYFHTCLTCKILQRQQQLRILPSTSKRDTSCRC